MMHHIAPFMSSNLYIRRICKHCGQAFIARTTVTNYCSGVCAKKSYKTCKRKEKIQATLTKDMHQQKVIFQYKIQNVVNSKDFLSVAEASKLIGVSRQTIQRMIQKGRLKAVPFGRKRIIARWQIAPFFLIFNK